MAGRVWLLSLLPCGGIGLKHQMGNILPCRDICGQDVSNGIEEGPDDHY